MKTRTSAATALFLALATSACSAPDGQALPSSTSAAGTASSSAGKPGKPGGPKWWKPTRGQSWQIQYSGALDSSVKASVYNLDWENTSTKAVTALHRRGVKVICYINAGGYEQWRPDAKAFPKSTLGKPLDDWPGERWLDVRQRAKLAPIMAKRMDVCKAKGFDAVDPDNMDGYGTSSGFPLKQSDAVAYQRQLIADAHKRGLAIGLKNSIEILPPLHKSIDFAVNEECVAYDECGSYAPMLAAKKPVFNVEYSGSKASVCRRIPKGMSTVIKTLELTAKRTAC